MAGGTKQIADRIFRAIMPNFVSGKDMHDFQEGLKRDLDEMLATVKKELREEFEEKERTMMKHIAQVNRRKLKKEK